MIALTTIFGGVQLVAQDALRAGLRLLSGVPCVDNLVVVSLRRDRLPAEFGGADGIESFRRELHAALSEFVAANGWSVAGTGSIVVNLLLRAIPESFSVRTRTAESLFDLTVTDARGTRTVPIRRQTVVVGREHDGAPTGFVPVADSQRVVSRRHLELIYRDSSLTLLPIGKNPTLLNGVPLGTSPVAVRVGDELSCGDCRVSIAAVS